MTETIVGVTFMEFQYFRFPIVLLTLLLSSVVTFVAEASKDRKVSWKDVEVLEKEPASCEFIDSIDAMGIRWHPFRTDKSMKAGVLKKLQKKAAKKKANTIVLGEKEANAWNASADAKVFWCNRPDPEKT